MKRHKLPVIKQVSREDKKHGIRNIVGKIIRMFVVWGPMVTALTVVSGM